MNDGKTQLKEKKLKVKREKIQNARRKVVIPQIGLKIWPITNGLDCYMDCCYLCTHADDWAAFFALILF